MRNQTILVVEDHARLLQAIRDILQGDGYEVETAIDGVDIEPFDPSELLVVSGKSIATEWSNRERALAW